MNREAISDNLHVVISSFSHMEQPVSNNDIQTLTPDANKGHYILFKDTIKKLQATKVSVFHIASFFFFSLISSMPWMCSQSLHINHLHEGTFIPP